MATNNRRLTSPPTYLSRTIRYMPSQIANAVTPATSPLRYMSPPALKKCNSRAREKGQTTWGHALVAMEQGELSW